MKPHKHAELIKAWADGAEIEMYFPFHDKWEVTKTPFWDWDCTFRIKPKPDVETYLTKVGGQWIEGNSRLMREGAPYHMLKLICDSETGKLKSSEVLK
jgi:hypothetical protein